MAAALSQHCALSIAGARLERSDRDCDSQAILPNNAIDGVEMRKSKPHSSQMWMVRVTAMHYAFRSKQRNVQVILIIPGSRSPSFFALLASDPEAIGSLGPQSR